MSSTSRSSAIRSLLHSEDHACDRLIGRWLRRCSKAMTYRQPVPASSWCQSMRNAGGQRVHEGEKLVGRGVRRDLAPDRVDDA